MNRPKSMPQQLKDLATYPKYVLELQHQEGFIQAYWNEVRHHDRLADAYETIEKVHVQFFGTRKYSNYASFRIVLTRRYSKK